MAFVERCLRVVALAAAVILLQGCCEARRLHASTASDATTPWKFISSTQDLSSLAQLITGAGLASALDKPDLNYTLLLPDNEAFAYLAADQNVTVSMLLNESGTALENVLLYHVFEGGALPLQNLMLGQVLIMANGLKVRLGQDLPMGVFLAFQDAMGRYAAPEYGLTNISLGSALGHVINRVLLPFMPTNLQDALSYEVDLSLLARLLQFAAATESTITDASKRTFTNLLNGNTTNVTLLAPSNSALAGLCGDFASLTANATYLKLLLETHVVPGALSIDTLFGMNNANVTTLNPAVNFTIHANPAQGTLIFTGHPDTSLTALVVQPDLVAGISKVHVLNTAFFPNVAGRPMFYCPPAPPSPPKPDYRADYDYNGNA